MFTIRRIFDDILPANRTALDQVLALLRSRFPLLRPETVEAVPVALRNPLKYRFQSILYVAEGPQQKVLGFALLAHEPVLHFGYLDYLVSDTLLTGRGVGGALYQRVREEAALLDMIGLFFECLPTVVVQEGGYDNRSIGSNAAHFFSGLAAGIGTSSQVLQNNRHVK